jgi:hypothetical protein
MTTRKNGSPTYKTYYTTIKNLMTAGYISHEPAAKLAAKIEALQNDAVKVGLSKRALIKLQNDAVFNIICNAAYTRKEATR